MQTVTYLTDWKILRALASLQVQGKITDLRYCSKVDGVDYFVSFIALGNVELPKGLEKGLPQSGEKLTPWAVWSERGPARGKMAPGARIVGGEI